MVHSSVRLLTTTGIPSTDKDLVVCRSKKLSTTQRRLLLCNRRLCQCCMSALFGRICTQFATVFMQLIMVLEIGYLQLTTGLNLTTDFSNVCWNGW